MILRAPVRMLRWGLLALLLLASGGLAQSTTPQIDFDRWVSLEAHSVCNQRCFFCPVSVAPREQYFMPTELYERIITEIADLGEPIEVVAMIQYNEPTVDRRFIDQGVRHPRGMD